MSAVIPERILQNALVTGIRQLRENPELMAGLFGHLSDKEYEEIVTYIVEVHPTMYINYPRNEPSLPGLILLLKNEKESQTFLGDQMGTSPHYGMPNQQFQYDGSNTAASVTDLSGLTKKLFGNLSVVSGTSSAITVDPTDEWLEFVESIPELPARLHVIDGTGKGQVRTICKINPSSIDIDGTFEVNLDSTSIVDIRSDNDSELIEGEPSRGLNPNARITRLGSNYETTYQLDIVAGSQEQVLYLYSVIKSIFYMKRPYIEAQGLMALRINGSDFAPRSEFLPDEVFHRVLNLTFDYPFGVFQQTAEPTNLSFNVDVSDPITQDELEAFSQSIEI